AIEPPVSPTLPDPAVAVTVPLQVLLKPLGVATTRPVGRESLNVTPASDWLGFGLVSVKVRLVDPLTGIEVAPNALLIACGIMTEVVAFAGTVLKLEPETVPRLVTCVTPFGSELLIM